MGDLREWLSEAAAAGFDEPEICVDGLQVAEDVAQGIIARIHPNSISEQRRKAVVDYVKKLLRNHLGCEVFPFGSVPLKTYLPDGDIDLTAFAGVNSEEALANDVFTVLDREDWNGNSEFVVKDVQLIRAEVKLVKFIVQNIVVDISFNQLGGLCTLCFLEQVDRLIGKDHLLKRSILLIKAWCYYESRILGAHHGLLSTYALETLVLYIFHLYHSSLNGPLAVFYKFLEFYSKFDWEKYCISLNGPVLVSSLPDIVVVSPEVNSGVLLFSNDFLKECMGAFSVPPKGFGNVTQRTFMKKHLNIVDPLKENNNLGRSVSRGNYFRIRSAFCFGVQKLERVMSETKDGIVSILNEMFSNTMDRHVSGQRPDVQDLVPPYAHDDFGIEAKLLEGVMYQENHSSHQLDYKAPREIEPLVNGFYDNVTISEEEKASNRGSEAVHSSEQVIVEEDESVDAASISYHPPDYANGLATARTLTTSNGPSRASPPDGLECISPYVYRAYHAPHLYFSRASSRQEERRNVEEGGEHPESSGYTDTCSYANRNLDDEQVACKQYKISNSLSELCGDYESHITSLQYGKWCYDFALAAQAAPQVSPRFASQFHGKNPWDVAQQSVQHKHTAVPQSNSIGYVPGRQFYPMNSHVMQVPPFGVEGTRKPRGTGTYIPSANHYRTRAMVRGRGQALPVQSHEHAEITFSEKTRRVSESYGRPHVLPSDLSDSESIERKSHNTANGLIHPPYEEGVESGPYARNAWSEDDASQPQIPDPSASGSKRPMPSDGISHDRIQEQSYHLKNDDDFPPLPETA